MVLGSFTKIVQESFRIFTKNMPTKIRRNNNNNKTTMQTTCEHCLLIFHCSKEFQLEKMFHVGSCRWLLLCLEIEHFKGSHFLTPRIPEIPEMLKRKGRNQNLRVENHRNHDSTRIDVYQILHQPINDFLIVCSISFTSFFIHIGWNPRELTISEQLFSDIPDHAKGEVFETSNLQSLQVSNAATAVTTLTNSPPWSTVLLAVVS